MASGTPSFRSFFAARLDRGFMADTRPRTRKEIWTTIGKTERLMPPTPIDRITRAWIEEFNGKLLDGSRPLVTQRFLKGMEDAAPDRSGALKPPTANKHLRNLHHLLTEAWEIELIARVPIIKYNRTIHHRPRPIPVERIEAIYAACEYAGYPRLPAVKPADWWQALLAIAVSCGFRRGALLSLRWDRIDWQNQSIWLDGQFDKTGWDRSKPMTQVVLRHLLRIRGERALILAWPHSERTLYREWHRIQRRAGIARDEHYKLHDLKRTCGTMHATAGTSTHAIRELLDHASIVTAESYINVSGELRRAVESVRLPPIFYGDDAAPRQAETG